MKQGRENGGRRKRKYAKRWMQIEIRRGNREGEREGKRDKQNYRSIER